MKVLLITLLFVSFACNAEKKADVTKAETTQEVSAKTEGTKEEDCDDKVKKPIEITEDSIKLGTGDTGCKIE